MVFFRILEKTSSKLICTWLYLFNQFWCKDLDSGLKTHKKWIITSKISCGCTSATHALVSWVFCNLQTLLMSSSVVLIRVSKGQDVPGRDVPWSLCPGTKKFPCPIVPLSWDKKVLPVPLSPGQGQCKNPGTNSSVPGRPGTKWILRNSEKKNRYPVLEHHFPVLEHLFLF